MPFLQINEHFTNQFHPHNLYTIFENSDWCANQPTECPNCIQFVWWTSNL